MKRKLVETATSLEDFFLLCHKAEGDCEYYGYNQKESEEVKTILLQDMVFLRMVQELIEKNYPGTKESAIRKIKAQNTKLLFK